MSKVCVFLAEGFEECEALLVVDLLRRAKVEVATASISAERTVTGSHGIPVVADSLASQLDLAGFDLLFLPGGMPGTLHLKDSSLVGQAVVQQCRAGKKVAAICAAPSVLGALGVLQGKKATCYPGFEGELKGAAPQAQPVVVDGNVTTACGMGAGIPFALELISQLVSPQEAEAVGKGIQFLH